ncbi:RNase H domain-containing protein [Trichonephila clavipes]|nr:RNase H domain-containing protein [Trichonephila clavipes]
MLSNDWYESLGTFFKYTTYRLGYSELSRCSGKLFEYQPWHLDGTIPVSLLPHPSCRKPITLVSYSNEVSQEYRTVCFTDGSKLNGRVGLACAIYEKGVEYVTFQHRLRDECSVFQAELLCINLAVKLIQDSLRQGGTLNFLICTDSLSSLHCLLNVNSTEKLVVEVQSILFYLDCDIHFSYVRGHSGNLGNDRADQLAKEATCQDVNLLMSVPLSHWKHLAWERTVSSWNTEFLASVTSSAHCSAICKKFEKVDIV